MESSRGRNGMAGEVEVVGDENETAGQSIIHCVKGVILW